MLLTGAPAERICATAAPALEEADQDELRGTFETALSTLILAEGLDDAAGCSTVSPSCGPCGWCDAGGVIGDAARLLGAAPRWRLNASCTFATAST